MKMNNTQKTFRRAVLTGAAIATFATATQAAKTPAVEKTLKPAIVQTQPDRTGHDADKKNSNLALGILWTLNIMGAAAMYLSFKGAPGSHSLFGDQKEKPK